MTEQREQVLHEVNKYAGFCESIQNNLANGASTVASIKELNHKIGIKNHDKGAAFVIWQKLRNMINAHKIMWGIVIYLIFFALIYLIQREVSPFNLSINHTFIILPIVIDAFLLIASRNPVYVPFIQLREDEKTPEYRNLESQLSESNRQLNQMVSTYEAFANNALIVGFITDSRNIQGPTIGNDGDFKYPYVSNRLKAISRYLQTHQAETIHEASMLYTQELAYENQVESNRQMVNNTADAAEYARQAANSARETAANTFTNLFRRY